MGFKDGSIFAVKKLNYISAITGVNMEAVSLLKVRFTCIYKEFLQKEIEVLRKLEHENIVKYLGSEIVDS